MINKRYRNKENGKIVIVVDTEHDWVDFIIDGIKTRLSFEAFMLAYEEVGDETAVLD